MSRKVVKFNKAQKPEFYSVLRKRVNQHFEDNNISKTGNLEMRLKSVFMIALYFTPMILMYTGVVTGLWPIMAMWALMGLGMSGIGLSIMHDANHGSYSKNKNVNKVMGFLINFLGAYEVNWIIQHNVLHHSYTNIDEFDGDIENPIMRFSPSQEFNSSFKYQAFYAPFLYAIMTLFWFLIKDFERISRYDKKDLLKTQGLTYWSAMAIVTFHKIWYAGLTLILPIFIVDLPWWQTVLGFLMMHGITGLSLALIFQPAHVIEETEFFIPSDNGTVENNWAIHQLKTTSNFANDATIFSWFIGGLNNQVEHHLFPKICHVHYRHISKIVEKTAIEYGIPYHKHATFLEAVSSHFSLLNALGNGSYDKRPNVVAAKAL
jgi:linoleoyl-CoA desaturase